MPISRFINDHSTDSNLICMALLQELTIQATVVVLSVCTHCILFTDKYHLGNADFHQPRTL